MKILQSFRFPPKLAKMFKDKTDREDKTMTEVLTDLVEVYVQNDYDIKKEFIKK